MGHSKVTRPNIEDVLIGRSRAISEFRLQLLKVAAMDLPVLITGESGTGKELAARLIHENSSRARGPLVVVNLATVPRELAAVELVGHAAGAFTGARGARPGFLEVASGGSLVLDELEYTPLELQPHLLNALELREIRRIGDHLNRKVDVRFVAITCLDLNQLRREGDVRVDLLLRLSGVVLRLPPLRERLDDIPYLAEHFIKELSAQRGQPLTIHPAALSALGDHEYPGNVRELYAILLHAATTSSDNTITVADLVLTKPSRRVDAPDLVRLKSELDDTRRELDLIRRSTIAAGPIWEGRSFPLEGDYCFVLMPFSEASDLQKVYSDHVKPVVEEQCGLRCERADDIYDISGVIQSVWEGINRARLMIADLTGRNPNVFYELGIAHTLGKPVIMLTQSMDFVPFDLRHLRCIVYEYKPLGVKALEKALERTIRRVLAGTREVPRLGVRGDGR